MNELRLDDHVLLGFKSVLSHNTAQKLLQDKEEAKSYLQEIEQLLIDMQVDEEQREEIIIYARMKARAEVKTIKAMYERYGITPKVSGHGGSEVSIEIILEQLTLNLQ